MKIDFQKSVVNNATSKILGIEYQKLIALEKCFNANSNEVIYIECLGDVAAGSDAIEVKHHEGEGKLTDKSIDIWKTLKNLVEEKTLFEQFDRFILHTTSDIKSGSIFENWNSLSENERYQKIITVDPSKTIEPFYDKVKACGKVELKKILKKLRINSSMPKIKEKFEQLKGNVIFTTVELKDRGKILEYLLGYITKSAIDNKDMWHIDKNDFDRDFRIHVKQYLQYGILFPNVSKDDVSEKDSDSFLFVKEIKKIKYNVKIKKAVSDYLRSDKSLAELIKNSPIISERLEKFEEELLEEITDKKTTYAYDLKSELLGTEIAFKSARDLFDNCLEIPNLQISGINAIKNYFQKGRIHSIVEEEKFKWEFKGDQL